MQKLLILSVTGLMLICGGYIPGMSVSAQNTTSSSTQNSRRISGVVTDTQGEPIIGATVLVKGTGIGTATDIDGKFSLDIPSNGKTLVVSFIGFDAQEIPVTKKYRLPWRKQTAGRFPRRYYPDISVLFFS